MKPPSALELLTRPPIALPKLAIIQPERPGDVPHNVHISPAASGHLSKLPVDITGAEPTAVHFGALVLVRVQR